MTTKAAHAAAAISSRSYQIPQSVQRVLASAICNGSSLVLCGQIDRALYTETNKVLEAIGGKWNKKANAHLFDDDAGDLVEQVLNTGCYTKSKQDFGVFYTPAELAAEVAYAAHIKPMMRVLEPSAGHGALAMAAKKSGGIVNCVEARPDACEHLRGLGFQVYEADFLKLELSPSFDRVVMNPPFAKRADIAHITRAFDLLVPGGELVAIASASVIMRQDGLAKDFRDFVRSNFGMISDLPEGSFKDGGTMVRTVMVTMEKPSAAEARSNG